jgi:hypothetical protein
VGLLLHSILGVSAGSQATPQSGGLSGMLGMLSGQLQQPAAPGGKDLVSKLAPAALEFMRAKASGADMQSAAMQAAMRTMMGAIHFKQQRLAELQAGLLHRAS